jgi:hypothetical protein
MMQKKLDNAYKKYKEDFRSDPSLKPDCIISELKTEENRKIILHREAIKINGLGLQVWNYFKQKERLDDLKKEVQDSIKQKCRV